MTNKASRRKLHADIKRLTPGEVAAIVSQQFPMAKGPRIDALAKQIIAGAHRQISPRMLPRMQRG